MPDVRVAGGGKIAIVAHCLLNQNTKPHQRARYPGVVEPILEVLQETGFALVQLPCPEIAFAGLKRWSQVIEQYDTPRYRRHCNDLAVIAVDQIEHYLRHGPFTLVTIGIEGSPSCGVTLTGSSPDWQGYPGAATVGERYPVREGSGIFFQELRAEFTRRELKMPPTFGVGLDLFGVDLARIGPKLRAELEKLNTDCPE